MANPVILTVPDYTNTALSETPVAHSIADILRTDLEPRLPGSGTLATSADVAAVDVATGCTSALNSYDPPTKAELDTAVTAIKPFYAIMPSDTLRHSIDTEEVGQETDYTEVKSFKCFLSGYYRIKFDLTSNNGFYAGYGRIYKDGIAYGKEQSQLGTTYVTKSEDLYIPAGSLISLYVKISAYYWKVRNFRVYGDYASAFTTVLS